MNKSKFWTVIAAVVSLLVGFLFGHGYSTYHFALGNENNSISPSTVRPNSTARIKDVFLPDQTLEQTLNNQLFNYIKTIGEGNIANGIKKMASISQSSDKNSYPTSLNNSIKSKLQIPVFAQTQKTPPCSIFDMAKVLPGVVQFLQFLFQSQSLLDPCFLKMKLNLSGSIEIYRTDEPVEGDFLGEPFIASYFVKVNWQGQKTPVYKKLINEECIEEVRGSGNFNFSQSFAIDEETAHALPYKIPSSAKLICLSRFNNWSFEVKNPSFDENKCCKKATPTPTATTAATVD